MRRLLALLTTFAAFTAQAWAGAPASSSSPYSPPPAISQQWQVGGTRQGYPASTFVKLTPVLGRQGQYSKHWLPYGSRAIRFVLPAETNSFSGSWAYRGENPIPDGVYTVGSIKAITAAGTNYKVGSYIVEPIQGLGTNPIILQVDAVDNSVSAGVGGVTQAHVVVGGAYLTQLADSTAQMAVWEPTYGFGFYMEAIPNGADISGFYDGQFTGGQFHTSSTTFLQMYPTSCTGGTLTPSFDSNTGAIVSVAKSGTFSGCATTNGPAIVVASTGATQAGLGSGATFSFNWKGYAYAVRMSVDPTFQNQTCSGAGIGTCNHRTVTATTGPSEDVGTDPFGRPADIFVKGGQPVVTDPLPLYEPAGAALGLRAFITGAVPNGRLTTLVGETGGYSPNYLDYSQSRQAFPNSAATNAAFLEPIAILVQPLIQGAALLAVGDSRTYGTDGVILGGSVDTYDYAGGASGWLERAVNNSMPVIMHAKPGDQLYGWIHNRQYRFQGLKAVAASGRFPELCYLQLSVNDFVAGYTFAQVQSFEAQMVQDLRGFGCKFVFTDTTDPHASAGGGGYAAAWANITAGGTGYAPSSSFNVTIPGGTGTAAVLNVSTNPSGVVTQVNSVQNYGAYSAVPTSTNSCASNVCSGVLPTGGTGSGLTLSLTLTTFTPTATQTQVVSDNTPILARNAQLRSANMGSYATASASGGPVYDGFIDWNGITENGAGSDNWVPYCTVDGLHAAPMCIAAKAAAAAAQIAAWAAQARTLN